MHISVSGSTPANYLCGSFPAQLRTLLQAIGGQTTKLITQMKIMLLFSYVAF